VVKGFNNLSAYMLMHGDPLTEHIKVIARPSTERWVLAKKCCWLRSYVGHWLACAGSVKLMMMNQRALLTTHTVLLRTANLQDYALPPTHPHAIPLPYRRC
jgi:hypothetical protein